MEIKYSDKVNNAKVTVQLIEESGELRCFFNGGICLDKEKDIIVGINENLVLTDEQKDSLNKLFTGILKNNEELIKTQARHHVSVFAKLS